MKAKSTHTPPPHIYITYKNVFFFNCLNINEMRASVYEEKC